MPPKTDAQLDAEVARAVSAERERCARIADVYHNWRSGLHDCQTGCDTNMEIAAKIREETACPPPPPGEPNMMSGAIISANRREEQAAACAHLKVAYQPLEVGQLVSDRWRCVDCGRQFTPGTQADIQALLLAERERCARIAEKVGNEIDDGAWCEGPTSEYVGQAIASTIRAGEGT